MKTLCIDPGVKAVGAALFDERELVAAFCSRSKTTRELEEYVRFHQEMLKDYLFRADQVVVERMVYRPNDVRSRPNSLLDVQLIGGALAGASRGLVVTLKPSEWKSALPKKVHHSRLIKTLSEKEHLILEHCLQDTPSANHKEVLDAVGIGLFFSKRTRKDGTRARG